MNPIMSQIKWMAVKAQPQQVRLVWMAFSLALFVIGAGAPASGGGVGE